MADLKTEPINFFTLENEHLDGAILGLLHTIAHTEGVIPPVIVLPDIHQKKSYHIPTGVVIASQDKIFPKFLNPNCGMSFVTTGFTEKDFLPSRIDFVFNILRKFVSADVKDNPVISFGDLKEIIMKGAEWSFSQFALNPRELSNIENNGSVFKKKDSLSIERILEFIPSQCQTMGLLSMGVLGRGNHFVEMQVVEEIINSHIAEKFGIFEKQVCFMIHSDSREFGRSIFDFYSHKAKKIFGLQQIYKKMYYAFLSGTRIPQPVKKLLVSANRFANKIKWSLYENFNIVSREENFASIEVDSPEGEAYLYSNYAALNYGYANRIFIAGSIKRALQETFGGSADIFLLYDGNHDSLQEEEIDGITYFVHRNGAQRALPPAYFSHHPIFMHTGQPVFLPSSPGNFSYLCAANKGCRKSFYSAPHGTGRIYDRGKARSIFTNAQMEEEMRRRKVRVYDYGNGNKMEEHPASFKDVHSVIEILRKYDIAEPVVKLRPLAVLKGWI